MHWPTLQAITQGLHSMESPSLATLLSMACLWVSGILFFLPVGLPYATADLLPSATDCLLGHTMLTITASTLSWIFSSLYLGSYQAGDLLGPLCILPTLWSQVLRVFSLNAPLKDPHVLFPLLFLVKQSGFQPSSV